MSIDNMPEFKIVNESNKFWIRDNKGTNYGSYDTKKQAEENVVLWQEYYAAPLVF